MIEPLEQRLRGEEPQPCGGELERQRQAVEPPADSPDAGDPVRSTSALPLFSSASSNSPTSISD